MQTSPSPTLAVRWDIVRVLRELRSLESDKAMAAAMGIDQGNLSRVLRGKQQPGPKFIAALCIALEASMNDLFVVVGADERPRRPKVAA